jgi:cytochrome c5
MNGFPAYRGCLVPLAAAWIVTHPAAAQVNAPGAPEIAQAQALWARSPHGRMLERILPPAVQPNQLPEPRSEGASLTVRYCVQCHHLPNPQMHTAAKWQSTVERMVWRMQGKGNLGALMKEMMAEVRAPAAGEVTTLTRYLQKHGQREIDPAHPALATTAGQIYGLACSQCHSLPEPRSHTAREWPAVVERMKRHMAWANVIVGASELRTVPELDTAEIVRFLQRYARATPKTRKPPVNAHERR